MTNNGEPESCGFWRLLTDRANQSGWLPLVRRFAVPCRAPRGAHCARCACRAARSGGSDTPVRTRWYAAGTLKPGFHCAILAQGIVVMRIPAQETQGRRGARAGRAALFGWILLLGAEGLPPLTHPIPVV